MPRICEICGRYDKEEEEQDMEMTILDVCPECSNDRINDQMR